MRTGKSVLLQRIGRVMPVVTAALTLLVSTKGSSAQEPSKRSFLSSGTRIDIQKERGQLSDEELARVLEKAAQDIRAKGMAGPQAPLQPARYNAIAAMALMTQPPADKVVPESKTILAGDGPGVVAVEPQGPRWQILPGTALYTLPIANLNEPRFYLKPTTLENANTSNTIDTGVGGLIPLLRRSNGDDPRDAFQIDLFGVVFSRWKAARDSTAVDYRFGIPFTWARGPWEFKAAYEHTSTHLGDEFIMKTGKKYVAHVREEAVFGAAYRFWDDWRVYGQYGYAFVLQTVGPENPSRVNFGLEWCSPLTTSNWGRPYAAIDLEFRGDQDMKLNFCGQVGWQWRGADFGPALRLGLEYYNGYSPYGQFFLDRERWVGLNLSFGY